MYSAKLAAMRALTPTEDADLRRLYALASFATSAPLLTGRFDELRARDRRTVVRDVPRQQLITLYCSGAFGDPED